MLSCCYLLLQYCNAVEMSEYVLQMDEECEGMQGMVMYLKQKVKQLEAELKIAKSSQKQKKIQQNDE